MQDRCRIKKATLSSIAEAARNTYPKEFIALVGRRNGKTIDEFVLLPSTYGTNFSTIRRDLVPFDKTIAGTAHSHPSYNNLPSKGDLRVFKSMGETHLIIAYPFSFETVKAFNQDGKELGIEVVE